MELAVAMCYGLAFSAAAMSSIASDALSGIRAARVC
jgi:hypothetical protein